MEKSPATFIRETRAEIGKISWPTRKETTVSTIMVLVLVFVAAVFFYVIDSVIGKIISLILGFGA